MMPTNPFSTYEIDKLCTICHLILKDTDSTHSIFSTLEELESPMTVLEVLQSFSNFSFYKVPQMVCTTCYDKTIEVYKFIQMCNKADENLQHYLKNLEAIKTIKAETDVDVKVVEISIGPTSIIIDGLKLEEEMENGKISRFDEFPMVISGTEIKIEKSILQEGMEKEETSNNEEMIVSHTDIVTEEKTDSSDIDNLRVEKMDPQMHYERLGLIKSKDCHLVFSDKKELDEHRQDAKRELSNALCETKYTRRSRDQRYNAKRAHISKDLMLIQDQYQPIKDLETYVVCLECQEVFCNDKQLKIHMSSHKKTFFSNDCGKVLTTKFRLNTPTHVKIGENPFNEIKTKATQLRHREFKNRVKVHKCEQCDRRFTQAVNLRTHMDRHNEAKAYKCEQCDWRFTTASHLSRHMMVHNDVKPHKCEACDRRFIQASDLRRHMSIHNGIKAHKCEQCDRQFTLLTNLRRHMNIHKGIKAHKCEQCDRGFTDPSTLRRHMNVHSGVKAYKCEHCDRRFTGSVDLCTHMDIHSGVKA